MNIDKVNDFNRLFAQTETLVVMASSEENIRATKMEDMANILWLVHDQLKRMGGAFNAVIESASDNTGGEA